MKTVFMKELRISMKNFLIWSLSVGVLGLICTLMYTSMEGDMKDMADAFSNMGAFADAFGMSTLSIATLEGFFATEVGTVHGLGGAMFAAIIAIGMLSKEEEGHTGEFLLSLPVSRTKVVAAKGLCIAAMLVGFTVVCGILYALGFVMLGEEIPVKEFLAFMIRQLLLDVEIAAMCYCISAFSGKNRMGLGIGLAMMFYFYDVVGRVVPDLKEYLFVGPFSYANASEIFSGIEVEAKAIVIAFAVIAIFAAAAFWEYNRRDLAA